MEQVTPGTIIDGQYQVLGEVSHGGMGAVYRVRHRLTGREEALKLIKPDKATSEEHRKRFLVEATAVARLTCPHTVTLYQCGVTDNGMLYFTMELLAGRSVSQALRRDGEFHYARAAELIGQACRSLEEAHQKNILHRDIKPSNLFLTTDDEGREVLKVLDFGIARFEVDTHSLGETVPNAVLGTPQYMSPEQWLGVGLDARSDIYSLGTVLYEMLAGRPPFEADTAMQLRSQVLGELPNPVGVARPGLAIPKQFEEIVLACLAKEPHDRPSSAARVKDLLQAALLADTSSRSETPAVRLAQSTAPALAHATTQASDGLAPADLGPPTDGFSETLEQGLLSTLQPDAEPVPKNSRKRIGLGPTIALLIALAGAVTLPFSAPARWLDEKGGTLRQSLNLVDEAGPAVVVQIGHEDDVRTLASQGLPVPGDQGPKTWRLLDALLLRKLADAKADVVAFDKYYGHDFPEETATLANAIRYAGEKDVSVAIGALHSPPPSALVKAGAYVGAVLASISGFDGTIRALLTGAQLLDGSEVPSLFVRAYCLSREPPAQVGQVTDAMIGCEQQAVQSEQRWQLRFSAEGIRTVRASDLLAWSRDEVAQVVKGKVVFAGHFAKGIDQVKVPEGSALPANADGKVHGVMLLATAFNQLDSRTGWLHLGGPWACVIFFLLGGLPFAALRKRAWFLPTAVAVLLIAGAALAGLYLPLSYPWGGALTTGLAALAGGLGYRLARR